MRNMGHGPAEEVAVECLHIHSVQVAKHKHSDLEYVEA